MHADEDGGRRDREHLLGHRQLLQCDTPEPLGLRGERGSKELVLVDEHALRAAPHDEEHVSPLVDQR